MHHVDKNLMDTSSQSLSIFGFLPYSLHPIIRSGEICASRLNGDQGEMKKPAKFADKQVLRENIFMIGARRAALTPGFPRPGLGRDKKKLAGWIMIHNLSGLTYG